jgi:hypothetical protein
MRSNRQKQAYVIFSVDTEHDISRYHTRSAGWSKGIPLLCGVFDATGLRGKVCWLIEYNVKDGILAANIHSPSFCHEFSNLIDQIKDRGDELGIHPSMVNWVSGGEKSKEDHLNKPGFWDYTRRYNDAQFVLDLIKLATQEFKKVCGANPVGCRTGALQYATNLANALEKNGIYLDSSANKGLPWRWVKPPNIYHPSEKNIYQVSLAKVKVLEIPTTGYINTGLKNLLLKFRTWFWLHQNNPIFLSFFIHNWQAITVDGEVDQDFLEILSAFLRLLNNYGARFLSWTEAYQIYTDLYENKLDN